MAVEVTDVPMTKSLDTLPQPVLKDRDISIYGLPVLPDTTSTPERSSSPSSLKRKREPSPERPSKRTDAPAERVDASSVTADAPSAVDAPADAAAFANPSDVTLDSILAREDFTPAMLSGAHATEYIQRVHGCMFSKQIQGGGKKGRKQQNQQVKGSGPFDANAPGEVRLQSNNSMRTLTDCYTRAARRIPSRQPTTRFPCPTASASQRRPIHVKITTNTRLRRPWSSNSRQI